VAICRSGKGGNGEIIEAGKGWKVPNLKYRPNSGVAKQIWLPASEPADGQWGASVVLVADTSVRLSSPEHHVAVIHARFSREFLRENGRKEVSHTVPTAALPSRSGCCERAC
jgi:hypothetical protein